MFLEIMFRPDLWGLIKCSCCQKRYNKNWYRDNDIGVPLYNRRIKVNPLTMDELQQIISGDITVEWFCSPDCSNEAGHLSKVENDSSSIPDSKT